MPEASTTLSPLARLQLQFAQDPALAVIKRNLPTTFIDATTEVQNAYLQALMESHRAKARLKPLFKSLKGIVEFAGPLLTAALDAEFGPGLDIHHDTMTLDNREWNWLGRAPTVTPTRRTLLEAALHNFTADEAEPLRADSWTRICQGQGGEHPKKVAPHRFAALCRTLDLGARYQTHINATLEPTPVVQSRAELQPENDQARPLITLNDAKDLQVEAHAAFIHQSIGSDAYRAILALARQQPEPTYKGQSLYINQLTLFETTVQRVVLIQPLQTFAFDYTYADQPCIAYIPHDPIHPLKEYATFTEMVNDLRGRLMDKSYQGFFQRFIGERQRAEFFTRLNQHLLPLTPVDGNRLTLGPWKHLPDHQANLNPGTQQIEGNLFAALYQQQMDLLRDNARFLATPTDDEDEKSRKQRLEHWLNIGLNIANVASFFVPALGAVMFIYAGAQIIGEVYHGLEDLSHDDLQAGLDHLLNAAQNLAFMAALGKIGAEAQPVEPPPITANNFVGKVIPIRLRNGKIRLWQPDLAPFQSRVQLPEGVSPTLEGVFEINARHYIRIDEQLYPVHYHQHLNKWTLEHIDPHYPFVLPLEHNVVGAFRHAAEKPQHWSTLQLFKRMGHSVAGLPDAAIEQVLSVTGIDPDLLRRMHLQNAQPPGQLTDTLKRFQLDRANRRAATAGDSFEQRYRTSESSSDVHVQLIQRDFPGLPTAVADELVATALPAEKQTMLDNQRIPLRLAEAAAWHLRQVRLNRAIEGFYLKSVTSADTQTLRAGLLEKYASETDLTGLQGQPLNEALARRAAADRGQAARLLGQTKPALRFNLPQRMHEGRLGYGLSGRGMLSGHILEDSLLDKIRLLQLEDISPQELVTRLRTAGLANTDIDARLNVLLDELQQLNAHLQQWALDSASIVDLSAARQASRTRIGGAIMDHWRANNLPMIGRTAVPLRLGLVSLADFPPQLPAFFYPRVEQLELHNITVDAAVPAHIQELRQRGVNLGNEYADTEHLGLFLRQFPHMTTLEINRSALPHIRLPSVFYSLPRVIAQHAPGIQDLRLINQGMTIGQQEVDTLNGFNDLQRLDLSGNFFSPLSSHIDFSPLNLQRLGLDRTDLTRWPQWLERLLPGPISEISLDGNHITSLPDSLLDNPVQTLHHTRISLRGNPLSRGTVIEARLSEATDNAAFSFNFSINNALQGHLNRMLQERTALLQALNDWAQASSSSAPLSEERLEARQHISDAVLQQWRAHQIGRTSTPLRLQAIALSEFATQLPASFYQRLTHLELTRVTTDMDQLNDFLGRFENLVSLTITGHVTPLVGPPAILGVLPRLQDVSLVDQGMLVDQQAMDFFARLPRLVGLDLSGNRLGEIILSDAMREVQLSGLNLSNIGMQHWPDWLGDLVPGHVDVLSLDNNQLRELPEYILDNPRNRREHTEISLRDNPLNRVTLLRAHLGEHGNHQSYSFLMDLPADIQQLRPESGGETSHSDSESESDSSRHSHSPWTAEEYAQANMEPWLVGTPQQLSARREMWQRIEADGDAPQLLALIGRLPMTRDFQKFRGDLSARVWQVLTAVANDLELRLVLNGMAEEPLQMLGNHDTCPDGIRLEFNQMEVQVFTRDALRDVPPAERGPTLYRLAQRLFRLHELDNVALQEVQARRAAGRAVDEAEVRLAYRIRLAERLDLPRPPGSMLYEQLAAVDAHNLEAAQAQVLRAQQGSEFMDYAAQRDFWADYLRESHRDEFERLKATFAEEFSALEERFPEFNDQYFAQLNALTLRQTEAEVNLLKRLTAQFDS
ncbi:MAG: NEL-type E3 ubiquitin ligase domain-containing protein [Pseudomonas sp.]